MAVEIAKIWEALWCCFYYNIVLIEVFLSTRPFFSLWYELIDLSSFKQKSYTENLF